MCSQYSSSQNKEQMYNLLTPNTLYINYYYTSTYNKSF